MAESPVKRPREDTQIVEEVEDAKRHKSYNHILSLLEAEEDEPNQDLSSLITTLQQEISSDSTLEPLPCPVNTEAGEENSTTTTTASAAVEDYASAASSSSPSSSPFTKEDVEDDKERVMRHLLEASDDELGIPNTEVGGEVVEFGGQFEGFENVGETDGFVLGNGLWELEDEAANYYTLLQSELFL